MRNVFGGCVGRFVDGLVWDVLLGLLVTSVLRYVGGLVRNVFGGCVDGLCFLAWWWLQWWKGPDYDYDKRNISVIIVTQIFRKRLAMLWWR